MGRILSDHWGGLFTQVLFWGCLANYKNRIVISVLLCNI